MDSWCSALEDSFIVVLSATGVLQIFVPIQKRLIHGAMAVAYHGWDLRIDEICTPRSITRRLAATKLESNRIYDVI